MDSLELVHVNAATRPQLAALLELTTDELDRVLAARPFAHIDALRDALPPRLRAAVSDLVLAKLDINAASEDLLVRRAGLPAELAARIVARRPYFLLDELLAVPGVARVTDSLSALFCVPPLDYVDKLSERRVRLTPDPSHVVVAADDSDAARALAERDYRPVDGALPRTHRLLATPPRADPGDWRELGRGFAGRLSPAFRDDRGRRYVDLGHFTVQFAATVDAAAQDALLAELALVVVERGRHPGLTLARLTAGTHDPGAHARTLARLLARPEVRFAEPNLLGFDDLDEFQREPAPPGSAPLAWNLEQMRLAAAWTRTRGSPDVVVAVIDSGVDIDHPALAHAVLPRRDDDDWNFADDDDRLPTDDSGHGTFIAGLLVGNGALGVHGVCPGCKLLPLKIPLLGQRNGYVRRRDAILYALRRTPPGARLVINLSWKTAGDVSLIRDAVDTAVAAGAVVVASAGNWPTRKNEPHFPSDYRAAISVSATLRDERRAAYSYFGDEVDIAAPGGDVYLDGALLGAAPSGRVVVGAGTSFAAPHVAGLAALLLSCDPRMSVADLRLALETTARPLTQPGMGSGLVDAAAAIDRLSPGPTDTPPPPPPVHSVPADAPATPTTIPATIPADAPATPTTIPADTPAIPPSPAAASPTIHDDILAVLTWSPTPTLHARLSAEFRTLLHDRLAYQLAAFTRAGVGARLQGIVADLPPASRERLVIAPLLVNRLLHREPQDLHTLLLAAEAEALRLDPSRPAPGPRWTALGDLYLPPGPQDRDPLAAPFWEPWRPDQAYEAPRIDDEILLDFDSPHARAAIPEIARTFTDYEPAVKRSLVRRFREGMAVVRRLGAVHDLVRSYARVFVLRNQPTNRGWSNSSYELFTGRVLCVNPHLRGIDHVELAEVIVHESIHSFIYVTEEWSPLIPDRDRAAGVKLRSPWSGRQLALHAYVHACFVWFGLWQFWRQALALGVLPPDVVRPKILHTRGGLLDPSVPLSLASVADLLAPQAVSALQRLVDDVRRGAHGADDPVP